MSVGFYFVGAGGRLQLPVNPGELTVKHSGNNQRTEVVRLGEINILRDTKLAAVSLDFLLPGDDYYPFINGPWIPPARVVAFFRRALDGKIPLRFVVSGFGLNMRMSVEEVTEQRVAGDHDSILCSLSLLQYRSYGAKVLQLQPDVTTAPKLAVPTRDTDKPENKTHLVQKGESLWAIAQRELGDGTRYNEIALLNNMTAASVIHPGDVLNLPVR